MAYELNRRQFITGLGGAYFTYSITDKLKARQKDRGTIISSIPMSLDSMVNEANISFIGTVNKTEGGKDPKIPLLEVQYINFRVEVVLKGKIKKGDNITVKQYAEIGSNIKKGEKVLWYLPKESKLGLTLPLGYHSGDFRLSTDPKNKKYEIAMNLKENLGLWNKSLFEDNKFSKIDIINELQMNMKVSTKRLERIIASALRPSIHNQIPIELLIAATRTKAKKLEKKKKSKKGKK